MIGLLAGGCVLLMFGSMVNGWVTLAGLSLIIAAVFSMRRELR